MYLAVGGRTWEQTSRPNELVSAWGELPVDQDIWGWEHDRGEGGHDDDLVVGLPVPQVWSLTQFYSVDFSQSRIGLKSAFSTNPQSSFVSSVFQ